MLVLHHVRRGGTHVLSHVLLSRRFQHVYKVWNYQWLAKFSSFSPSFDSVQVDFAKMFNDIIAESTQRVKSLVDSLERSILIEYHQFVSSGIDIYRFLYLSNSRHSTLVTYPMLLLAKICQFWQ